MRITFGLSIGETVKGEAISPVESARCIAVALEATSTLFGGCFLICGQGGWICPTTNCLITEPGIQIVVELESSAHTVNSNFVDTHARYLRDLFQQTAVIVSVQDSNVRTI